MSVGRVAHFSLTPNTRVLHFSRPLREAGHFNKSNRASRGGNRTNVLELSNRNVAYGYDNDYRLTSEAITADPAGNNGTVSYTQYDAVGNRPGL